MNKLAEQCNEYSITSVNDLKGKRVLLRLDLNTTLGENQTVDPGEDWRIIKSYRTIDYLVKKGARVIIISHIGRAETATLKPIYEYMSRRMTLGFIPRYDDEVIEKTVENMQHGSVVMLENLRQNPQEKEDESSFLRGIIALCDLYVNEAFSVSHRNHASVHDITRHLPSYFGMQFCDEVNNLEQVLTGAHLEKKILVLGGAKFGTKMELLKKMLPHIDKALIGGALANVFLREQGHPVGKSFVDDVDIRDLIHNEKIALPVDVIIDDQQIRGLDDVGNNDAILDIGPQTNEYFESLLGGADTIIWNGPMGKYEEGFNQGSVLLADSIAKSPAFSVTGGGDTATVILEEGCEKDFNFISTGGGAMLDFLIQGTLPGIEAIFSSKENK